MTSHKTLGSDITKAPQALYTEPKLKVPFCCSTSKCSSIQTYKIINGFLYCRDAEYEDQGDNSGNGVQRRHSWYQL